MKAGLSERDLHFHDLRGTAATKFYTAGLSMRLIAEIMAWEEENVERIIRRYVTRGAAMRAAIQQLNGTGGERACKNCCKTRGLSPRAPAKPLKMLERVIGIEPTTSSLGSLRSTTELHPRRT